MRIDSPISCNAQITGSFTGSFIGDGSQIFGVTAEWDGSHNGDATITGSLTISSNIIVDGTVDGVDVAGLNTSYLLTSASAVANAASITSLSSSAATALRSEYKAGDTALSSSAHAQRIALITAGDSALSSSAHSQRVALDSAQTSANNNLSSSMAASLRAEYVAADSALSASQKTYIDAKVAGIVDSAPGALDTLNELAAALGDDANFATTTATAIGEKLAKASNLSDLADAATARTNLGVDTKANTWTGVSGDISITSLGVATVADDSHNHIISNIDGLQAALDAKQAAGTYNTIIGTDTDLDTTGAEVVDQINVTDGVIESMSKRTLTLADLGYTGTTNANTYAITDDNTSNVHFEGLMVGQTTGATANTIRCVGDVVAYYSSDAQFKDNVTQLEGALDKVKQIRGVSFDWNDKQEVYEGHDIGVIAQEVEAVYPELVHHRAHDDSKAVDYVKLTAVLIEAVKELAAKVEELSK